MSVAAKLTRMMLTAACLAVVWAFFQIDGWFADQPGEVLYFLFGVPALGTLLHAWVHKPFNGEAHPNLNWCTHVTFAWSIATIALVLIRERDNTYLIAAICLTAAWLLFLASWRRERRRAGMA